MKLQLSVKEIKQAEKCWAYAEEILPKIIADWKKMNERFVRQLAIECVQRAVRKGVIKKPKVCQECARVSEKIWSYHHNGYENTFDVKWYCLRCHPKKRAPGPRLNIRKMNSVRARWDEVVERMMKGDPIKAIAHDLGVSVTSIYQERARREMG